MRALVPCPACRRHVRSREAACPFCGGSLPAGEGGRVLPATRLGRAATFAFGATLAGAAAGCSTSPASPDAAIESDAGVDGGSSTTDGGSGADGGSAGTDGGGTGTDGGTTDAGSEDAGPIPDAGELPIDAGGIEPPYGAPPAP